MPDDNYLDLKEFGACGMLISGGDSSFEDMNRLLLRGF